MQGRCMSPAALSQSGAIRDAGVFWSVVYLLIRRMPCAHNGLYTAAVKCCTYIRMSLASTKMVDVVNFYCDVCAQLSMNDCVYGVDI